MWLNRNTGIRTHGSLLRLTLPPGREDVPTVPAHRRYAPVGRGAGSPDAFWVAKASQTTMENWDLRGFQLFQFTC